MLLRRLIPIVVVVLSATQSFSQDAKLIDAAKKEGGKV